MSNPAYTWIQQLTNGGGGWFGPKWQVPTADDMSIVPPDDRRVLETRELVLPAGYDDGVVHCSNGMSVWQSCISGIPMQVVPQWVGSQQYKYGAAGYNREGFTRIPVPGKPWVEGMPRVPIIPLLQEAPGAWDRHWIGVQGDKIYEVIQLDYLVKTALGFGVFDLNGNLLDGRPVCQGEVAMAPHILSKARLENPGVLFMGVSDYGKRAEGDPRGQGDGALDAPDFVPGDHVALKWNDQLEALVGDARKLAEIGRDYGFILRDRSGHSKPGGSVTLQPGRQWAGSNVSQFRFQFKDLVKVTATS